MNKKILVITATAVLLVIGLSGCEQIGMSSPESKFIGTWKDEVGDTIIFYSDGTFTSEEKEDYFITGTYEVKNIELILTYGGRSIIYRYTFSNNDEICRLTSEAIDHTKLMYKQ